MSRGPATFRKSDVKRGIKALESAGLKVGRVEISREGKIILFPDKDENSEGNDSQEIKL
jgi:hypothetical protein